MSTKSFNPKYIFNAADSFLKTAHNSLYVFYDEKNKQPDHVAISIIANYSFATELFLKSILTAQGKPATGHNLADLFEQLDQSTKNELEQDKSLTRLDIQEFKIKNNEIEAENEEAREKFSFSETMKMYENSFIDYRYLYEKTKDDKYTKNSIYGILIASHTLRRKARDIVFG
ncbi:hypothetical protein ACHFCA_52995 (plasmid) [Delftia tsuruhatensis]